MTKEEQYIMVRSGAFEPVEDPEMSIVTISAAEEYTSRQNMAPWVNQENRYPSLLFAVDEVRRNQQLREDEVLRRLCETMQDMNWKENQSQVVLWAR